MCSEYSEVAEDWRCGDDIGPGLVTVPAHRGGADSGARPDVGIALVVRPRLGPFDADTYRPRISYRLEQR